jgi:hypothetical protein
MDWIANFIFSTLAQIVGVFGVDKMLRPKLEIVNPSWVKRKWVILQRIEPAFEWARPFEMPIIEATTDIRNVDPSLGRPEGQYFDFYGIAVKNIEVENALFVRKEAEILRAKLRLNDGKEIECRWWTRDHAAQDALFRGQGSNLNEARNVKIPVGTELYLVLAYRLSEGKTYALFGVDSDVDSTFAIGLWDISGFPKYAKLKIFTSEGNIEKKLRIEPNNKDELEFVEIKDGNFPDGVRF